MAFELRFDDGTTMPLYGGVGPKPGETTADFIARLRRGVRQGPHGCRFGVLTADDNGSPHFRPLSEEEHQALGTTSVLDLVAVSQ